MSSQATPSDARPRERADFPDTIPSILGGSLELVHYFPHVWTQPRGTEPFALYWSDEQELGQLFPMPSADDLARSYVDDYYTHEAGLFRNRIDPSPTLGERARVAIAWRTKHRQLPDASYFSRWAGGLAGRICDVGCGDGALLASLAKLGHDVLGIEPDAEARGAAAAQGVRTLPGSGEALPDNLYSNGSEPSAPRPSDAAAWRLLARTLFSAPAQAYDTVGVVARKPR